MTADREPRVALCVARFYSELADRLEDGARRALAEVGDTDPPVFSVPGAYELPTVAMYVARSGRFDGIVCLGAVIRGETDHYEYVCSAAADGILRVSLDTGVPCGFGVLTVDTLDQALARVSGGDKRDTGAHAAEAVLAALSVRGQLARMARADSGARAEARRENLRP